MRISSGFLLLLALAAPAAAQAPFSSGSTGADGPLVFTAPPPARGHHALAFDSARGVVVMYGGIEGERTTWEFDGTRWVGKPLPSAPPALIEPAMAYDTERAVVVLFGGQGPTGASNQTWEYDGTAWSQRFPAQSPSARSQHRMVYDAARQVVVLHGGSPGSSETWAWDGTTWTRLADGPGMALHALAYDAGRQEILALSGAGVFVFDGTTWQERHPSNRPPSLYAGMAYHAGIGKIVFQSGIFSFECNAEFVSTWTWDGSEWTQLNPPVSPPKRRIPAMVYDSVRAQVVIFGGDYTQTGGAGCVGLRRNDTWTFDGTSWSRPNQTQADPVFDMTGRADGIWNFTTIDIAAGVTLSFKKNAANTPVFWLASGDVNVGGTIDLDGGDPVGPPVPGNEPPGGPGGFAGGLGGRRFDQSGSFAAAPGAGPGGGLPGTANGERGGNAGYRTVGAAPLGGPTYGSPLLQPLVGGSGGGGDASTDTADGDNGGGGGGALLIASSTAIRIDGGIHAEGGAENEGNSALASGCGSGGAIRVVANRIEGGGTLAARGGCAVLTGEYVGGDGRIRTEAFFLRLTGSSNPPASVAPPLAVGSLAMDQIRIVSVAGVPVASPPHGDPNMPDVTFSSAGPVTVTLATTGVPAGTTLTVRVTAAGQVITATSTPTDGAGAASATLTVPAGLGTIQAFAQVGGP